MTPRQILEKARKILSNRKRWTRLEFARDESGSAVSIFSDEAVQFCAVGALHKAEGREHNPDLFGESIQLKEARRLLFAQTSGEYGSITEINDRGGYDKVIEVFDRTLTELKQDDSTADN